MYALTLYSITLHCMYIFIFSFDSDCFPIPKCSSVEHYHFIVKFTIFFLYYSTILKHTCRSTTAMADPSIGGGNVDFAIPPAGHTIRITIDKTAKLVSNKVGPGGLPYQLREFERKIKAGAEKKNANTSSKFAFLDEDNIYHQYYLLILQCEQEGLSVSVILCIGC